MKVVGIDQSLNGTGFAYRDGDAVMTGRVDPKKLRGIPRLSYIKRTITEVLDYAHPDIAVMEEYAFSGGGGGRVFHIGEIGGVLKILLWERGIDVIIVGNKTMKRFIAGKGNAEKPEMVAAIKNRFGLIVDSHDEADGCGLMLTGEAWMGIGPPDLVKEVQKAKKGIEVIPGGTRRT